MNLRSIDLSYLISMYQGLTMGDNFFNDFFPKLAGTSTLKNQIINGLSVEEIRNSWKPELENLKKSG
jgi:uncharacterized protein YbbC (DUF1343 family)